MNGLFGLGSWFLWLAILWSIPWKGMALWKAARRRDLVWFIVLLLVNTVGLLDIAYLYFISERRRAPRPGSAPRDGTGS